MRRFEGKIFAGVMTHGRSDGPRRIPHLARAMVTIIYARDIYSHRFPAPQFIGY